MDTGLLKVLADDTRLGIVRALAGGEKCLCEISEALGISDSLASHHVKRLKEAGLVRTRRRGLWLHCRLERGALDTLAGQILELGSAPETDGGCAASGEGCCS